MRPFSKKFTRLLTVLVLGLGLAQAGSLAAFLRPFDANQDGRLDAEEAQAARDYRRQLREERRNSIDANDDGRVTPAEIAAAREQIRATILERRRQRFIDLAGQDELLTLAELAILPQLAAANPAYLDALFVRLDQNEDGSVSFEEFTARLR